MKINIFSLPTVILINWLILVFVTLLPADIYERIIDEPYFANLHGTMFFYVSLALLLMWLGWAIVEPVNPQRRYSISLLPNPTVLNLLRAIGLITSFIYIFRFSSNNVIKDALASQISMNELRDLISEMSINYLIQFTLVSNIICIYLTSEHPTLRSNYDWLITIISIITLLLIMQRNILIPYILALCVAFYRGQKQISPLNALRIGTIGLTLGLGIFMLVAFLRAPDSNPFEGVVGYTISSYNRLALMLDGYLEMPDANTGYYSFQWLYYPPVIREIIPVNDIISSFLNIKLPETRLENYYAQFDAIDSTPLINAYIWTTFFGTMYADYGWLSLIIYLIMGACSQYAYTSMQNGQFLGVFLYCYIYATSLLWFGDAFIFYSSTFLMCYMAIICHLLALWLNRKHTQLIKAI